MAGTPPLAKRMKSRVVKSVGKLEGWFSGDADLINKYLLETSSKSVSTPNMVSFTWMKQKTGHREKHPQRTKIEEIPKAHWEHISRFGESILH